MELAGDALPGDLEALRALALRLQQELVETGKMAANLEAERDALTCERDALALDNERLAEINARLEHYLARLRRLTFGRRSEQMDPDQLQLALEDTEQAIAEALAEKPSWIARPGGPGHQGRPAGEPRCPSICRKSTWSSSLRARHAPAVAGLCTPSVKTSPSVWTSCRSNTG